MSRLPAFRSVSSLSKITELTVITAAGPQQPNEHNMIRNEVSRSKTVPRTELGSIWRFLYQEGCGNVSAWRDIHRATIRQMGLTEMPVIRVHAEKTCPFLPAETSQGPGPTEGQCHLFPLMCILEDTSSLSSLTTSAPAAPDKICRQSLPQQWAATNPGPGDEEPRADTTAHLHASPSPATAPAIPTAKLPVCQSLA